MSAQDSFHGAGPTPRAAALGQRGAGTPPRMPAPVRAAMWLDYFVLMPMLARLSWRAALWWGRRRGDLLFWWRSVGRHFAIANLLHAYHGTLTAAEACRITRRSFQAQTCEEVETFFFPRLTREAFMRFIHVEGSEHLDRALALERGAIVFSSHYGSICLAMVALARLGYKVNVLARSIAPEDNPLQPVVRCYAERKVAALERMMDRPFIITGAPGAMLKVRRALKERELLFILLSVPPELAHRRGRVRFLGHPAELPLGAEFIAATSGAPLVPFTVRRNASGRTHTLTFGPAVPGPEAGEGTLQRCVDVIEHEIRIDPSQFFMWEFARSFWIDESHVDSTTPTAQIEDEARVHAS